MRWRSSRSTNPRSTVGPRCRAPLPVPASHCVRKTIAAAGFIEAARDGGRPDPDAPPAARLAVQPRARGRRATATASSPWRSRAGQSPPRDNPVHDPDLRMVRAPLSLDLSREGLPARDLRRGPHRPRREDERGDPQLPRTDLHRNDGDRAADREAGLRRLPRLRRRPSARGCDPPRPGRSAPLPARAARGPQSIRCPSSAAISTSESWRKPSTTRHSTRPRRASIATGSTTMPEIVYAAGVDHAYHLAQEFRAAGLKAEAVSGEPRPSSWPRRSPRTSVAR